MQTVSDSRYFGFSLIIHLCIPSTRYKPCKQKALIKVLNIQFPLHLLIHSRSIYCVCVYQVLFFGPRSVLNSKNTKTVKMLSWLTGCLLQLSKQIHLPHQSILAKTTKATTVKISRRFRLQDPGHTVLLLFAEVHTGRQQREGDLEIKWINCFPSCCHTLFRSGSLSSLSQESTGLTGETWVSMMAKTGYEPCPKNQIHHGQWNLPQLLMGSQVQTEEPRITSIFLPVPPFPF